jgi:intein/homing endonuclease
MLACGLCFEEKPRRPHLYICFAGGTPISTPSGRCSVDSLKVNDLVLAYDIERNEVVQSRITAIHRGVSNEICILKIGNDIIRVTPQHPFYVIDHGWISATQLKVGWSLLTIDDSAVQLGAVTRESARTIVYNLSVDGQHNYFVGNVQVLVHNK